MYSSQWVKTLFLEARFSTDNLPVKNNLENCMGLEIRLCVSTYKRCWTFICGITISRAQKHRLVFFGVLIYTKEIWFWDLAVTIRIIKTKSSTISHSGEYETCKFFPAQS
mgnify:CR=1 FL=1